MVDGVQMIELIKKNKIYHMASMARSGETLMLKILAVHPDIKVIHNLDKEDDDNSLRAFQFLKDYKPTSIARNHKLIKPYKLKKNQIILIKQGVWKHKYPFKGFVLARNPVSIFASMKSYYADQSDYNLKNNYWYDMGDKLHRWLSEIAPQELNSLGDFSPIEQFCFFYNIRMEELFRSGLPIIKYEDLVEDTEAVIRITCKILGVKENKDLLSAHNFYKKGMMGHGKTDLSRSIEKSSLTKYKEIVSLEEFNFIKNRTQNVYENFGYKLENFEIYFK